MFKNYTCRAVICHITRKIGPKIQKGGTLWSLWIEAFAEDKAKWVIQLFGHRSGVTTFFSLNGSMSFVRWNGLIFKSRRQAMEVKRHWSQSPWQAYAFYSINSKLPHQGFSTEKRRQRSQRGWSQCGWTRYVGHSYTQFHIQLHILWATLWNKQAQNVAFFLIFLMTSCIIIRGKRLLKV